MSTVPFANVSRREFLRSAVAAPLAAVVPRLQPPASAYSVLLLGDVHFDKPAHHDMEWVRREKPPDVQQIENYTRLTEQTWPKMLGRLRQRIAESRSSAALVPFVAQLGDLTEGLCGTPALAERQARDVIESLRGASLGAPFLFCKGNHDITGPGAKDAFDTVLLPFVRSEMDRIGGTARRFDAEGASLALAWNEDWFLFLDAYDPRALGWLEHVLSTRTARHVFLLLHPPVVPYGARSTWILFGKPGERDERRRLLGVLGRHGVFVLSAHIHKYSLVVRRTDAGPFLQLALCSVVPSPAPPPALLIQHASEYTPDQVRVEASFSPETETERRAVLAAEAPHIGAFEYADVPGYASLEVQGPKVSVRLYAGASAEPWRSLDLVRLRDKG
jgi:hypothetical protein